MERGRSRSQLFHLQPLPVSFHLPLDAGPGSGGDKKKKKLFHPQKWSGTLLHRAQSSEIKELAEEGRGGDRSPGGLGLGCIALAPACIPSCGADSEGTGTVGFGAGPFAAVPLERLPAPTWREGHGGDPGTRGQGMGTPLP